MKVATRETTMELLDLLRVEVENVSPNLIQLNQSDSRYVRDLKVNVMNTLTSDHLSAKETALIALAVSVNLKNTILANGFQKLAAEMEVSLEEIAESISCASLLASNNVLYRFRHFMQEETYNRMPGKIKMNIMMKPVLGKEFFELMSLGISAVNGCEMCVNAHEESVLKFGSTKERVWDTIRLVSVITSLDKIVY